MTIDLGFAWTDAAVRGRPSRSSTCPGTSGSCRTCWPASARCRPRCSWSPPTRAGCRSPPSTSPRWTRSACGTGCSRSPAATSPTRRRPLARARAEIAAHLARRRSRRSRSAGPPAPASTTCAPPSTGWSPALPAAGRRRAGAAVGRPVASPSGAAARWSPARSAPGRLRAGDELELTGAGRPVRVRGLQSRSARRPTTVAAVARVAVNLRGVDRDARPAGATRC